MSNWGDIIVMDYSVSKINASLQKIKKQEDLFVLKLYAWIEPTSPECLEAPFISTPFPFHVKRGFVVDGFTLIL